MTYLQLVNKVLVKLRESQSVTLAESTYISLIADFVNEAKTDVENAWDWTMLRTALTINCVPGTSTYSMTNARTSWRFLKKGNYGYNTTVKSPLTMITHDYYDSLTKLITPPSAAPSYFRINGVDSSGDSKIDVYPTPDATDALAFTLVVPQAELSGVTDVIKVPWLPVVLGAYALAIEERGEDGGTVSNKQDIKYRLALDDAISQDAARVAEETTWESV